MKTKYKVYSTIYNIVCAGIFGTTFSLNYFSNGQVINWWLAIGLAIGCFIAVVVGSRFILNMGLKNSNK